MSKTGGTFDPTKPFRTMDGREVARGADEEGDGISEHSKSIVGLVSGLTHRWHVNGWHRDGLRYLDLVNIPEPPADVPSEDGESDADFVERMARDAVLVDEDDRHTVLDEEFKRLIDLARRAISPSGTKSATMEELFGSDWQDRVAPHAPSAQPDAYRICDVTGRPWDAVLTQEQVDKTLHSGSPGSYAEQGQAQGAEPVAWQYRVKKSGFGGWGNWQHCNGKPKYPEDQDIEYRPLYAAPAQPDAYRAGLMRGAEIAEAVFGPNSELPEDDEENRSYRAGAHIAKRICAEAAAPPPDLTIAPETQDAIDQLKRRYGVTKASEVLRHVLAEAQQTVDGLELPSLAPPDLTTPYTPRIVDLPDGTSELVLADALVVWEAPIAACIEIGWSADRSERVGVRWLTRDLPGRQKEIVPMNHRDETPRKWSGGSKSAAEIIAWAGLPETAYVFLDDGTEYIYAETVDGRIERAYPGSWIRKVGDRP